MVDIKNMDDIIHVPFPKSAADSSVRFCRNWLRDYSQAMDTGALKKAQPETIRILVWLLSFLAFGYATAEFEVTSERLGVYRPEEHIE